MSIQLSTRVMHIKDETTGSYDTVDILKGSGIDDVQINGISVVEDGVADIPMASPTNMGAVKVDSGNGLYVNPNSGQLRVYRAVASEVKTGTNEVKPITPYNQHESAFYGLAKVAGADEKDSILAVGNYTDAAKVAIQKMLGIYEAPWELIREDTFTNAEEADHIITVDGNGQAFELTDIMLMFETPKQETASGKGSTGRVDLRFNNSSSYEVRFESGSWTQAANADAHGIYVSVEQKNGLVKGSATQQSGYAASGLPWRQRYITFANNNTSGRIMGGIFLASEISNTGEAYVTYINIRAVTGTGHYRLYGKRKWS